MSLYRPGSLFFSSYPELYHLLDSLEILHLEAFYRNCIWQPFFKEFPGIAIDWEIVFGCVCAYVNMSTGLHMPCLSKRGDVSEGNWRPNIRATPFGISGTEVDVGSFWTHRRWPRQLSNFRQMETGQSTEGVSHPLMICVMIFLRQRKWDWFYHNTLYSGEGQSSTITDIV